MPVSFPFSSFFFKKSKKPLLKSSANATFNSLFKKYFVIPTTKGVECVTVKSMRFNRLKIFFIIADSKASEYFPRAILKPITPL